jgi:hypothetical protein
MWRKQLFANTLLYVAFLKHYQSTESNELSGLEETQILLKKLAGWLNTGFFTGFSGETGFLIENVHVWGSRSAKMQLLGMQPP